MNPTPPFMPQDPTEDSQGDLNAPDIVGPTGEEMPAPRHAEVHDTPDDGDGSGQSDDRERLKHIGPARDVSGDAKPSASHAAGSKRAAVKPD